MQEPHCQVPSVARHGISYWLWYHSILVGQRECISSEHFSEGFLSRIWAVYLSGLLWSQQDFEWRWSVPLFKCFTVLEFSCILFDLCLLITFFNIIMNYVPIVTFWIFTYHKIWILSIMFCFIWSYWIIYFLACLEVSCWWYWCNSCWSDGSYTLFVCVLICIHGWGLIPTIHV